jgi:hypothetical protein
VFAGALRGVGEDHVAKLRRHQLLGLQLREKKNCPC